MKIITLRESLFFFYLLFRHMIVLTGGESENDIKVSFATSSGNRLSILQPLAETPFILYDYRKSRIELTSPNKLLTNRNKILGERN